MEALSENEEDPGLRASETGLDSVFTAFGCMTVGNMAISPNSLLRNQGNEIQCAEK